MGVIMSKTMEEIRKGIEKGKEFYKKFSSAATGYGIDLNKAAAALGESLNQNIIIRNADLRKMLNGVSGFTYVRNDGIYIVVNSIEPPSRQRFTVAHELGHIYLGDINVKDLDNLNIVYRSELEFSKNDPENLIKEHRANAFASEILMPGEQVIELLEKGLDSKQLAEIFGVSIEAMNLRIAGILY